MVLATERLKQDGSEEAPMKSNYDLGPRGILNELKAERLKKNRLQKIAYKKLVVHICQENRVVDLNTDQSSTLEVQPQEIKLINCLQVILNAGWSVSKENWEDLLEVSGIFDLRTQYWDNYNMRKDQILTRDI